MNNRDWFSLGFGIAILNLLALGFGVAESMFGLERFYPVSAVTSIIYASKDVAGNQFYRIPATFANAHSYAGTMVATLPLLIGAWIHPGLGLVRRGLLLSGISSALAGALMANARVHIVAAAIVAIAAICQRRMPAGKRLIWAGVLGAALLSAFSNERLQRFMTLADTEAVEGRIQGSVNRTFFEILVEYPMGNGLGGGGTSIPSFLEGQVNRPIAMESEYARILLEQGVIGLLLWAGFIWWFFTASRASAPSDWFVARRLTWCCCGVFFGLSLLGTGLLTAIPMTAFVILGIGWVMVPPAARVERPVGSSSVPESQIAYVE